MSSSDVRSSETIAQNARGKNFQKFSIQIFAVLIFAILVVGREKSGGPRKISRYTAQDNRFNTDCVSSAVLFLGQKRIVSWICTVHGRLSRHLRKPSIFGSVKVYGG